MKEQIKVNFDTPNSPKIEEYGEVKDSLFEEIYKRAYIQINEIFSDANKLFPYNIIPIIGGRGSGKTSIALSISEHLKTPEKIKSDNADFEYNFEDKNFVILNHIDVGHLESGEDLFAIVLARMLGDFKRRAKSADSYAEQAIYQKFSKLYNSYVNLSNISSNTDMLGKSALAVLSECDASQNLRGLFKELVSEFVSFIAKQDGKIAADDTFIVVTIDDIDVNVPNTYKMLEQIQNYMMIPNVIVILTASQKTLENVCKKNYVEYFKDAIQALHNTDMAQRGNFIDSCNELGREYMNKILPTGKMIYLDVEDKYEFMLSKSFIDGVKGNVFVPPADGDICYTKAILYKIQKATGVYFYANEHAPFFAEPKSLRAKGQYLDKIRNLNLIKSHRFNFENKQQLQEMRNNLIIICDDIERRYLSTLDDNQFEYLKGIVGADIDEFTRKLYISLKNLIGNIQVKAIRPDGKIRRNIFFDGITRLDRNSVKFVDLLPYIDGLRSVYDDYKEYSEIVLALFTIKLRIERINRFLKVITEDELKNIREKNQIDSLLIRKYIGFGLFGKMENQLVNHLHLKFADMRDPDQPGSYRLIAHKENLETSLLFKNKIIERFQLNMNYINAMAVFLMFLSENSYKLSVKKSEAEILELFLQGEENGDLAMELEFAGRVDFSLSSFFTNVKNTDIIDNFYSEIERAVKKWNMQEPEYRIDLSALTLRKKEFAKNYQKVNIPYSSLNLELMYNVGCRVREKVKAKTSLGTPWEVCCAFFEDFGRGFEEVESYYSEMVTVNEDDANTKKVKGKKVAKKDNENYEWSVPSTNRNSLFYLNDDEAREFGNIMKLFNWEQIL